LSLILRRMIMFLRMWDASPPPLDPQLVLSSGVRSQDNVSRPDVGIAAIAFDIKGPEIRIGRFHQSISLHSSGSRQIPLTRGERIALTTNPIFADCSSKENGIYVTYSLLPKHVQTGSRIYVDDGNVELEVVAIDADNHRVIVQSLTDLPLTERKGVNLPGIDIDLPNVTKKDEVDMQTARDLGVDFIFASFVQSGAMVREIRKVLGPNIGIVSKIESQSGIDNYEG
jgi:pyruvate kinase